MNLWEYWLALSSSDRDAPAPFFRQLVISLPTSPEGPLIKMRSWFVDLVEEGVSPLLRDVDGESGLTSAVSPLSREGSRGGLEKLPTDHE
jgi:hypothetical protein